MPHEACPIRPGRRLWTALDDQVLTRNEGVWGSNPQGGSTGQSPFHLTRWAGFLHFGRFWKCRGVTTRLPGVCSTSFRGRRALMCGYWAWPVKMRVHRSWAARADCQGLSVVTVGFPLVKRRTNQSPPAVHSSKWGDTQEQVYARTRTRFMREWLRSHSIAFAPGTGGLACWLLHGSESGGRAATTPPPHVLFVQQRHKGGLVVGAHGLLEARIDLDVVELDAASGRVEGARVAAEEGPAGERCTEGAELVARSLLWIHWLRGLPSSTWRTLGVVAWRTRAVPGLECSSPRRLLD
ncbi:hypothetical protein SAMN05421811_104272 [Nonomuraea wenchangensis]|uniref:Uncharacterized protein n=1 Tax=Nonomuraea wenchangensis TaxID=568860 RepID=A0A1I0HEK4_9ACTN|nr:hypothetical protein SAMN05421811_104272 [Nonomuraea wenchangensis]